MSALFTFGFLLYSSGGKLGNGNNVRTGYAFNDSDGKELSSSGPRNANTAPWVFAQKA